MKTDRLRWCHLSLAMFGLLLAACGSGQSAATTAVTSATSAPLLTTSSTLAPGGYVEFPDIGIATVLPSEWVLEQEMNRRGVGAMLYDAGETAALVVFGRTSEFETVASADLADLALGIASEFASSWFDEGVETVSAETASVIGADAATAQVRLDHEGGSHTVTRATVVQVEDESFYVVFGYQGALPAERVEQGLEVLDRLALLP